ncbi:uncharacterized protein OCT59_017699 [Rhizophagus irregularis]|uniref:uncharacterized protein n=1 Tax=Rhizophagus irregularis TaxID=588596 RepID=UPI0033178C15|nr:hypothetical protein OCT59_017699 [Rhizophagus irregularis]
MEEFILTDDIFEQIKDFDHKNLTKKQILLIDKLIFNKKFKIRYIKNGLCIECKQPNTAYVSKFNSWQYENFPVILKCLNNSQDITSDFLIEIGIHSFFSKEDYGKPSLTSRCFGITKDPESKNFMMVMGYAKDGSLRQHLNNSFKTTKWFEKLDILKTIAKGLEYIHQKGLIHRDFHCGNILKDDDYTFITDLGLCRPVNVKSSQNECKELYGVLPYVAPEVLRGKGYTQESDIYGFGIIVYEVCTGLPPYHDIVHDKFLAISICQGLRPKSNYKIPQLILNIIKQCWDADPLKRPKAKKLSSLLHNLWEGSYYDNETEIKKQIEEVDKINEKLTSSSLLYNGPTLSYTTNPQAVYTSRLLDFKNLPKPKNAIDNKDDDNSFGEYSESIEAIDFTKLDLDKSN